MRKAVLNHIIAQEAANLSNETSIRMKYILKSKRNIDWADLNRFQLQLKDLNEDPWRKVIDQKKLRYQKIEEQDPVLNKAVGAEDV